MKTLSKESVLYIRRHPLLKIAAASYTPTLLFFEEEFQS
jgi:hypothetical protein